ncbi:hypothetical protein MNB_SM-3-303 [hydrothermal vent metagenome]|uniref:Uncharacterized protein n=1 Tax=hydrothermal vent metagenome TaxID=652676 RepID=A0A1W1D5E2_9ZZZZ
MKRYIYPFLLTSSIILFNGCQEVVKTDTTNPTPVAGDITTTDKKNEIVTPQKETNLSKDTFENNISQQEENATQQETKIQEQIEDKNGSEYLIDLPTTTSQDKPNQEQNLSQDEPNQEQNLSQNTPKPLENNATNTSTSSPETNDTQTPQVQTPKSDENYDNCVDTIPNDIVKSINALHSSTVLSNSLVINSQNLLELSRSLVALKDADNVQIDDNYVRATLTLADNILEMANKIGEMSDRILIMADKIGDMSDRIVQTQRIQNANVALVQKNITEAQKNLNAILTTK